MTSSIVDSPAAMADLVDKLVAAPSSPPSIYVRIEDISLARKGSVSILQLYHRGADHVYLIDIHTLEDAAFDTGGAKYAHRTLETILESPTIPKVFFDVRNDSDALYNQYSISLQGVIDIQLMENASRPFARRYLSDLQKCIGTDAPVTSQEKVDWYNVKERAMRLFLPEKGGRYEVFYERPMREEIVQYCLQDVRILPKLYELYLGRLKEPWKSRAVAATLERVRDSQRGMYRECCSGGPPHPHASLSPCTESFLDQTARLSAEEAWNRVHEALGDVLEDQDEHWDRFDQQLGTLLEDQDQEWEELNQQLKALTHGGSRCNPSLFQDTGQQRVGLGNLWE